MYLLVPPPRAHDSFCLSAVYHHYHYSAYALLTSSELLASLCDISGANVSVLTVSVMWASSP